MIWTGQIGLTILLALKELESCDNHVQHVFRVRKLRPMARVEILDLDRNLRFHIKDLEHILIVMIRKEVAERIQNVAIGLNTPAGFLFVGT